MDPLFPSSVNRIAPRLDALAGDGAVTELEGVVAEMLADADTRPLAHDWIAEQLDGLAEDPPHGPSASAAWVAAFRAPEVGLPMAAVQLRQVLIRQPPSIAVIQLIAIAAHPAATPALWADLLLQVARMEPPGASLAEFLSPSSAEALFSDAMIRGRLWQLLDRGYAELESLIPRRALPHATPDEWQSFLVWVYGQNSTERVPRLAMEAILSLPASYRLPIRESQVAPDRLNARTVYLKKLIGRIYARIRRGPTDEEPATEAAERKRAEGAPLSPDDAALIFPLSYQSHALPFARPKVLPVVGARFYVEKPLLGLPVGAPVLCVHAATFGGQRTYCFVLRDGRLVTLTEDEVSLALIFDEVPEDFTSYRYRDARALRRDAETGWFNRAFPATVDGSS